MTTKKVFLSNNIIKVLQTTNEVVGYIAGWDIDTQKFCVSVSRCIDYFLTGLKVNGIFCILNDTPTSENEYLKKCKEQYQNSEIDVDSLVVLFACKEDKQDDKIKIVSKLYFPYYNTINDIEVENISSTSAVLLRAQGQIPCLFEATNDPENLKENINQAIDKIKSLFQKEVAAFLFMNTKLIQHSLADETEDSGQNVKQLIKFIQEENISSKAKNKTDIKKKIPTNFDILVQTSGDRALESSFNHSIVIHCQTREFQCASVQIPLDALIVCQETDSTLDVYKLFLKAIEKQLTDINECLVKYTKSTEVDTPTPYHFYPDMWDLPITLIYPFKKTDEELQNYRKELHRKLLLPMNRPFLKKLNAYDFSSKSISGHLYNPHEGLSTSGIIGGKCAIVEGLYSYHHYMQDHVNDNGWGCAYRSLQTIISWFKHQGYTDKNIPTHEEIQRALVAVGDKPESFIGSNKWIGSQEVSFCLNHLINVESRIMFVPSGTDMASKGRELFNHFRNQGTPVMIGGGVLAHTILGVDFNQETGDLKFLILDPHYTGKEDINIILNKGWCGWKDLKFWDQTAFYNLCLPQRPEQI